MVNHFQQFYRTSAGYQLGLVLRQVDHLADLICSCLDADMVGVFHRQGDTDDPIGLAFCNRGSRPPCDVLVLKDLLLNWPDQQNDSWIEVCSEQGLLGEFSRVNQLSNGLYRSWSSPGCGSICLLAFAGEQPIPLSHSGISQLDLAAKAILECIGLVQHVQGVSDFSRRLGRLLEMHETHLVDTRYETTLTVMLRHLRGVVPSSGAAIVSYDKHSDDYEVLKSEGYLPIDGFVQHLTTSARDALAGMDRDASNSTLTVEHKSISIDEHVVLVVPLLIDDGQSFAASIWRDEENPFSPDDIELVHLFTAMVAPLLRNADCVRHLVVSHQKMKESSGRLAEAEALAALTDMTSGIAHDLNNVMGGIIGRLQLMRIRASDPKLSGDLELLEEMALEGAQTVASIQEFSSSTAYLQPERVDLRTVVDQCLNAPDSDWRVQAEKRSILVRLQSDVHSAVIEGCADKLVVALEHLLENAVDHSPDGGHVVLALEELPDEYRLSVADHGPGIPDEIRGKIFYPFFSTKQGVRSSGLGLAVVHGTVVRHGGSIAIDPDWERGTRMIMSFRRPLGFKEDSDVTRRAQRRSGLDILIVDDDEQIREVLTDMLSIEGHSPVACADGYAALEAAKAGHFDIMVTDLGMPGMSGLDLAGLIRESCPDIAIGMITGWGTQLDRQEIALKGIGQVLAKPFRLTDVREMVRKLVSV